MLGLSAANSGNLLIPMLPGIVLGGILSGVPLSRTGGHYRLQVLVGTGLTTIGMVLISTMDETTGIFLTEAYLVVAGLGLGVTLAAVSVAVQNTVPSGRVGSGTAANQFYRSVGGMMGLAVMGVLNAARVLDPRLLTIGASTPARPDSRSPCKYSHLRALPPLSRGLKAQPGEKCGLVVPC